MMSKIQIRKSYKLLTNIMLTSGPIILVLQLLSYFSFHPTSPELASSHNRIFILETAFLILYLVAFMLYIYFRVSRPLNTLAEGMSKNDIGYDLTRKAESLRFKVTDSILLTSRISLSIFMSP